MNRLSLRLAGALAALAVAGCGGGTTPPDNNKPKPEITTFAAQAATVARGAKATLNYAVTKATSVTITDDQGNKLLDASANLSGSVDSMALTANTTFTLSATGEGGTTTKSVTVNVDASAVAITHFEAMPATVEVGGSTRLSWTTVNATQVVLSSGGQELKSVTGAQATSGTYTTTVTAASTTFHLVAKNDMNMMATQDVTVTAVPPLNIVQFRATPQTFSGASAMISLNWVVVGASMISVTANGTAVPNVPMTGTSTIQVMVTANTTFELTATSPTGRTQRATQVAAQAAAEMEPNDALNQAQALAGSAVSATLSSPTDVDNFSFMVPNGGNIYLETSDGMGGCTAGLDTQVELFAPDGTSMGVLDVPDTCDKGDPVDISELRNLAGGTYTAAVSAVAGSGAYTLIVLVRGPACGNSFNETLVGETCDDANMMSGDGCDSSCHFEIQGTVSGPPGDMMFSTSLSMDQSRTYAIDLNADGYILAETVGPNGPLCDMDTDTILELSDSTGAVLASNDDASTPDGTYCSRIDAREDTGARVPAGHYILRVSAYHGAAINAFTVHIKVYGQGCGNGILEMPEVCDDGNTASGDGCSPTCTQEVDQTINGTGGNATVNFSAPNQTHRIDVVIATAGQSITATVTPPSGTGDCLPVDLTLSDAAGTELGTHFGFAGCPAISPFSDAWARDLAPGTYHLDLAGTSTGSVKLVVVITAPTCGDGLLERKVNEQCDDGNTRAGDGCTAACRFDSSITVETEPNDVIGMANSLNVVHGMTMTIAGAITSTTDQDVFAFTVPANQHWALTAQTYGRLGDLNNCSADTIIELQDNMGRQIARNDDRATGEYCSEISMTVTGSAAQSLGAGRYNLIVTSYNNRVLPAYFMNLHLQ
ncbi:MAG: DUF4215 domain-containing protein [Myxococcota bacterium]